MVVFCDINVIATFLKNLYPLEINTKTSADERCYLRFASKDDIDEKR